MGRYITASEAARRVGVTDKTIRKWIAQGKLDAHHVTANQLAILETDVERIIRERRLYEPRDTQADLLTRLISLEQKVTEQEGRIASLERQAESLQSIAEKPKKGLVPSSMGETTRVPAQGPEIANREARDTVPAEFPGGTLSAVDFAEKICIPYTVLDGYIRRGVRGEQLDVTEIPHPTRAGYSHKYFSREQQEKAIEILKRHGKIKGNNEWYAINSQL